MNEIVAEIQALKKACNAIILAHNYMEPSVQDIADFVGDSLELSIRAKAAQMPTIVFCGVSFMAETAKILSPDSTVIHPVPGAGCPMADMASAKAVAEYRRNDPDTVLVAYVNTTAAVKAEVDICCTSANAEKIIKSIPSDKKIMFLPDRNLGANVSRSLGRAMELWPGFCPTHNRILPEMIEQARRAHPDAEILIHPECHPEVVELCDAALSTGGMLRRVKESAAKEFVIATECGIVHRMEKENPDKQFYLIEPAPRCPNMKKISLEDILFSLRDNGPTVELDAELIKRAVLPIERMLMLK